MRLIPGLKMIHLGKPNSSTKSATDQLETHGDIDMQMRVKKEMDLFALEVKNTFRHMV